MVSVSTKIMLPATTAVGRAMWRYAMVILACTPRRTETAPVPTIPRNRETENEIRVPRKVTSKTRSGIPYQRGGRGFGDIRLTYTIQGDFIVVASFIAGRQRW